MRWWIAPPNVPIDPRRGVWSRSRGVHRGRQRGRTNSARTLDIEPTRVVTCIAGVPVFAAVGNKSLHHVAPGTQAASKHRGSSGRVDSHARREDPVAGVGPDRSLDLLAIALGSDNLAVHDAHAGFTRCGPQAHVKSRPVKT